MPKKVPEKNIQQEILEDAGLDSSDYAKKQSVFSVYKSLIIKISLSCLGLIFLILAIILMIRFFKNLNTAQKIDPPPVIVPTTEPQKVERFPTFAYIKDKSSIWTIDTNGKNRKNVLELSNFNEKESYTTLNWKDADNLTYSYCSGQSSRTFCRLYSYNIIDRSQTLEQNLDKYENVPYLSWSPDLKYLAFIAETKDGTGYYFRSGNVITLFSSFLREFDDTRTKSKILFTDDNQYVAYYAMKKEIVQNPKSANKKDTITLIYPLLQIFRVNGVKVDEFKDAYDPFLIDNETIGYRKTTGIYYKKIGSKEETLITKDVGFHPTLSFDKQNIAYWANEVSDQRRVVLQVFDTKINIKRDILRGIILPIWLSDTRIAGIKADNCLGEQCLLFEFQTAGLVIIDISTGLVVTIDQGASITNVMYNDLLSKPASNETSS